MLYVKYVFSGHQSLSLNIQDNSWRGLNVYDGRVGRTLSQEIFKRFWNNFDFLPLMSYDTKAIISRILFDFVPLMIYDTKTIISCISFIANVFEWTENPSLLEVFVRHESGWVYRFHWRVKGRLIFTFNELLDREEVCICLQLSS